MEYQKGFIEIILIIAIGLAVLFGGAIYSIVSQNLQPAPSPSPTPGYSPVACTMEAKQCPDGSYVGRSGPNCEFAECPKSSPVFCTQDVRQCADGSYVGRVAPACEFAPCPTPTVTGERILLKEGQREGPLLVQKMYANYITGLNYREYPGARKLGREMLDELIANMVEGELGFFEKKYKKYYLADDSSYYLGPKTSAAFMRNKGKRKQRLHDYPYSCWHRGKYRRLY